MKNRNDHKQLDIVTRLHHEQVMDILEWTKKHVVDNANQEAKDKYIVTFRLGSILCKLGLLGLNR